jgi:cell division protein FtsQ
MKIWSIHWLRRRSVAEAKIRRGGATRKRPRVAKRVKKVAAKQASLWTRFKMALPFSQDALDRAMTAAAAVFVGGVAIVGATLVGVPQYLGIAAAKAVGRAGFEVKRVEVTGINKMERLAVYSIALDQHSLAMPLVDLEKVREQLLQYNWVADARVSRRLPDTLVVDIVERKAAAIWQHNQQLALVDEKGVILDRVKPDEPTPDLPLLIGPDANRQAIAFTHLIQRAPALKPMIASASWVGDRRWDIGFQTGETLALPEGEEAAGRSMLRFARVERVQHLLGGRYVWFDMRNEGKLTARFRPKQAAIDKPGGAPAQAKSADAVDENNEGGKNNGPA